MYYKPGWLAAALVRKTSHNRRSAFWIRDRNNMDCTKMDVKVGKT
jgi:hypothetical protein